MAGADLIAHARAAKRTALDEASGKALLAAYGIIVPRSCTVGGPEEVAAAVAELTPPFVVKVMSPDILHKSDVGGVKINLQNPQEVAAAIHAMRKMPAISASRVDGFLVEEMAPRGLELVIGGVCDPQFGPLIMIGLGGIFVEVLKDVSFRICPITRLDAEEMLGELKGAAILDGARGVQPASRMAIVDVLLRVGGEGELLMAHATDIVEADINPLIVSDAHAVAVDARFILA
jgi:acyl-CoA synthetase (NDP forming)